MKLLGPIWAEKDNNYQMKRLDEAAGRELIRSLGGVRVTLTKFMSLMLIMITI